MPNEQSIIATLNDITSIISIITIAIMCLGVVMFFIKKNKLISVAVCSIGFIVSWLMFFILVSANKGFNSYVKLAVMINFILTLFLTFVILIKALMSKKTKDEAFVYISCVVGFIIAIIHLCSMMFLWVDIAEFANTALVFMFWVILISGLIKMLFKIKEDKNSFFKFLSYTTGGFLIWIIICSLSVMMGANHMFDTFYSQAHKQIYLSDNRVEFLVLDTNEAKFVANKIKSGEKDIDKIINDYAEFLNKNRTNLEKD